MVTAGARNGASWDFPRSPIASRHLLETAEAHGLDAATVLAGTGLTVAQVADPSTEVQATQELTIARNLLHEVDEPTSLGVETGLRYSLVSTGILGYAFLTSPTVRDAITIGRRFAALSSTFLDISTRESEDGLVLELDTVQIPADVRRFLVVRDLVAISQIAPLLVAGVFDADLTVELGLADLPLELAYLPLELLGETGLEVTVDEGASLSSITIPHELLDQPMPAADPDTAASCIAQCEELLERRRHRGEWRRRYAADCWRILPGCRRWGRWRVNSRWPNGLCTDNLPRNTPVFVRWWTRSARRSPSSYSETTSRSKRSHVGWATPKPRRSPRHSSVGGAIRPVGCMGDSAYAMSGCIKYLTDSHIPSPLRPP